MAKVGSEQYRVKCVGFCGIGFLHEKLNLSHHAWLPSPIHRYGLGIRVWILSFFVMDVVGGKFSWLLTILSFPRTSQWPILRQKLGT